MLENRVAIWVIIAVVGLWGGLAAAEPPTEEKPEGQSSVIGQEEPPGVVIEVIPKGSTLEKAGLQVGDVITAWKRLPNPPANSEAAEGAMASYFDWQGLEVEHAPRGTVVLRGRRGNEALELTVMPGLWEGSVRPFLPATLEAIYEKGKTYLAAGDVESAVRAWKSMTEDSSSPRNTDSREFHAWMALRSAEAWGQTGEWGKALDLYNEALKASESPAVKVTVWADLGQAYEKSNAYEAAASVYSAALKLLQQTRLSSLGVAGFLGKLGLLNLEGDLSRAEFYLLQSLDIFERLAPRSLEVATRLSDLGVLAQHRGGLEHALDYHLRALRLREELAPQTIAIAESLNNLGTIELARGNFDRGSDYLQDARQLCERLAPESLELATTLMSLANAVGLQGDLAGASDYFSRALQIQSRRVPQGLEYAATLTSLGAVISKRGDLDQAQEYHLKSWIILERLAPQSRAASTNLSNLGFVALQRGDLERASSYLTQALWLDNQRAPLGEETAVDLINLGSLAITRGDLDSANDYLNRALRIQMQIASESLNVASTLNNLGRVAWLRGDSDLAHEYYTRAVGIQERLAPQSLALATTLNNLGRVFKERRNLEAAYAYHFRSLQLREHLAPRSLDVASSLSGLAAVAEARGDLVRAHEFHVRALEAVEQQVSKLGGSYNVQAGFRSQHRAYYRDTIALLLAHGRIAEAFQLTERFRAQTFLTMLAERDVAFTADIPDELDRERRRIGVLYDRNLKKLAGLNPRDNAELIETTRKELRKLDAEAGDIEARIRSASPKLAALRYPQPLDTTAAQQALDPGTLLVSFSVGKDRTTLFALSRGEALEVKTLPVGEEALRTRIKQFLSLLQEAEQGSSVGELRQHRIETVGRELFAALLGPVTDRIAASERLLILPDGPLHALPFAALVRDTKEGPQSLVAWKPLHVALSATVYAELKQRRQPASDQDAFKAPFQLAAFGDPVYPQNLKAPKNPPKDVLPTQAAIGAGRGDPTVRGAAERGLFDFQPLPYTRREVLGIASLFPEGTSRTFLGPEALEERIKSLDPKTRILHLAAHGSVDEHLPSGSFIALTIPEETISDDTGPQRDNGLLQVWEIFERVRLNADLVVLSACDTGLGEELGGEGLIGLTRAFQYAGARSVLASLWNVQDQATSELMIRFYKHLRAGLPKDQALQAAQQELFRGPIEVINEKGEREIRDLSSPYFWAGFQLYGDWQ